jgi:hypothetical protein
MDSCCMDADKRLQEAIKQTDIAIEETDEPDIIRELETGREHLTKARERFSRPEG